MEAFIKTYWPVLVVVIQLLALWVMWSLRKTFVSVEACSKCQKALDGRVSDVDKRQGVAEATMAGAASCDDLTGVMTELERLRGDVREVRAHQVGQGEILKRIEQPLNMLMDHHMRGGK